MAFVKNEKAISNIHSWLRIHLTDDLRTSDVFEYNDEKDALATREDEDDIIVQVASWIPSTMALMSTCAVSLWAEDLAYERFEPMAFDVTAEDIHVVRRYYEYNS
jgi:hypothetical protein